MSTTQFDDAIAWSASAPLQWEGTISEDWLQGRTAFGGLISAIAVRCMRNALPEPLPLLTLETAFLGPIGAGPANASVTILRQGRHVTQVEARLSQAGEERARVSGVFGKTRASTISIAPAEGKPSSGVEGTFPLPYIPNVTPIFVKQFDLRWTEGNFPFTGSKDAVLGGYCRHRSKASGVEAVIALADAWPAPVLPLLDKPAPASSVRWTLHFVGELPTDPDAWYWLRSSAITAGGGYATMVMNLYGPDLRLVAWGEQLVAVFDG